MESTRRARNIPTVKTLEKALRLLLFLGEARKEMPLQEIARRNALHPSTAYRILTVLARHHFVHQGPTPGRYSLGLRLASLGHVVLESLELRASARPVIERLMEETREKVHLMMLDGDAGVYVDQVESPKRIRVAATPGYREPLHCSAIGKAILAHLPADRFEAIAAAKLPKLTPRTITDVKRLRKHCRDIRMRGYALDNQEGAEGIRCVGAPIFDYRNQVIGSLSVTGPAFRLTIAKLNAWGPLVRKAADEISALLGFNTWRREG